MDNSFSDDWLERTFAAGQWYLAERDHLPYAALRLLWTDAVFWGERERGDAAHVHTLVVRRDLAGQGLGT